MTPQFQTFVRSKRTLAGAAALICYAAAIILAPSGARSQLDAARPVPLDAASPIAEAPVRPIMPRGDAFAPRAAIEDERQPGVPVPLAAALPRLPGSPSQLRNATPATRVTAIATGIQPSAIVENGGRARLLTVGDALDGSTIATINTDYVELADGRRLPLAAAGTR